MMYNIIFITSALAYMPYRQAIYSQRQLLPYSVLHIHTDDINLITPLVIVHTFIFNPVAIAKSTRSDSFEQASKHSTIALLKFGISAVGHRYTSQTANTTDTTCIHETTTSTVK